MWKSVLILVLILGMGMGLTACGGSLERQAAREYEEQAKQAHRLADAEPRKELWDEVNGTDPGPIPPNWQALAEAAIHADLKDPNAEVRFNDSKPRKSFFRDYSDAGKSSAGGSSKYYARVYYSPAYDPYTSKYPKIDLDCLKKCEPEQRCWHPDVYWLLSCDVSSKKKSGGYTGLKPYWVAIKDGKIYSVGFELDEQYFPEQRCDAKVGK
jgi:hypothetical protein